MGGFYSLNLTLIMLTSATPVNGSGANAGYHRLLAAARLAANHGRCLQLG